MFIEKKKYKFIISTILVIMIVQAFFVSGAALNYTQLNFSSQRMQTSNDNTKSKEPSPIYDTSAEGNNKVIKPISDISKIVNSEIAEMTADSYEPNNTMDIAKSILNNTTIYPTIDIDTDVDWFVIDATKTGKLNVTMKSMPSGCDYDMTVYDSSGTQIGGSYATSNQDEKFATLITATGNYYIRINSVYGASTSDTYDLNAGIYAADSYEVDDSLYTVKNKPSSIYLGNCFNATLDNIDDTDCFKFDLNSDMKVGIRLKNIPIGNDYDLIVYKYVSGSGFVEIGRSTLDGNSDESIISQLAADSYYIKVYSYTGSSETQYYNISLTDENAGSVKIDLDKTSANVGDIITAAVSVNNMSNFSGYQFNISYDSGILQPVEQQSFEPYTNSTEPSSGTMLLNSSYSPFSSCKNDIIKGILNFGKTYMNLESYRQSGSSENSGVVAVILFKVIQPNRTSITFSNTGLMPECISGTYINDWFGNKISSGYNVIQPPEINSSCPAIQSFESIDESKINLQDTAQSITTLATTSYTLSGYIGVKYQSSNMAQVLSGFTVQINSSQYMKATTDSNGYFLINSVPGDVANTIYISKAGFVTRSDANLVLTSNKTLGSLTAPIYMAAGDIPVSGTQDNVVNMTDVVQVAKAFNKVSGQSGFVDNCDFNKDGSINMSDIVILAMSFGFSDSNYTPIGETFSSSYNSSQVEYSVSQNLIQQNQYTYRSRVGSIKAVVVHYVGNPGSTALANRNYFNNQTIYSSAHYVVGLNGEVIQCVPDAYTAFHAGGDGDDDKYYTSFALQNFKDSNGNRRHNDWTIGIETCHLNATGSYNISTYTTFVRLTADLLKKYNINPDVYLMRHYDMTNKLCPMLFSESGVNDYDWILFKKDVKLAMKR